MYALTLSCWLGVIASALVQAQERSVDLPRYRFDHRFVRGRYRWSGPREWHRARHCRLAVFAVVDCDFHGTRVLQRGVDDSQVEFRMSLVDLIDRLECADNGPNATQPAWRTMYSMTSP